MSAALAFEDIDILFGPRRRETRARALRMLDEGGTRQQISDQLGILVGVAGANLAVERGEISVLMGLSGSGKSSLLRAANGLNPVDRGRILVGHDDSVIDLARCPPAQLRDMRRLRLAMVFQQFGLLPWRTVRENVGLGLELRGMKAVERRRVVEEKLHLVGLDRWADAYASALSGGMQQRVGLARAFATEADILLMDEPFSALDPLIRSKLQDELLDLQARARKTIVFVSHDMDEALKIGNRISILREGRIVQTGTPDDIVLRPADSYVADFVSHMNPLAAMRAASVMRAIHGAAPCWIDAQQRYRLISDIDGRVSHVRHQGADLPLSVLEQVRVDAPPPGVAVVAASTPLRAVVWLAQATGHPVLVGDGAGIAGACCDVDIVAALARGFVG